MKRTNIATIITTALFAVTTVTAFGALTWTEDFALGGDPANNDWDNGDVTDGQTWLIPNENDSFGFPHVAAKQDATAIGGTGNNRAGRLRVLNSSALDLVAAVDLTSTITDGGTLNLLDIGDGTGDTPWRLRLKDSGGTTALELVFGNSSLDNFQLIGSQVNSGQFIQELDQIQWRSGIGANLAITFDVITDMFSVAATETSGGGTSGTGGFFAFDNAVTEIARIEFVADQINTGVGSELSFESIVLTQIPEPGALALIGIGALVVAFGRRTRKSS